MRDVQKKRSKPVKELGSATWLWIGVMMIFAAPLAAQETSGTENAILKLWFRDADTGIGIVPHFLTVDEKPVYRLADPTGRLDIPVTDGDHQIVVRAKGYDEMSAKEAARAENSPMNIVLLDPNPPHAESTGEVLEKLLAPGSSVIAGYVTDDHACTALEGAIVSVEGTTATAETDERGFFAMTVPLLDAGPLPEDTTNVKFSKKTFRVSKAGYGTEERTNVLLLTDSPKKFQIRMVPGGKGNSLDEEKDRGGLQQWTFGVPDSEGHSDDHDPVMHDEPGVERPTTGTSTRPGHEGHNHP